MCKIAIDLMATDIAPENAGSCFKDNNQTEEDLSGLFFIQYGVKNHFKVLAWHRRRAFVEASIFIYNGKVRERLHAITFKQIIIVVQVQHIPFVLFILLEIK
jgi:hypothetical protein